MAEFCMHEKHGGICNLTSSYCNLGPCPNEEIEEFVPVHHARWEFEVGMNFYKERNCPVCKKRIESNFWSYCPNCGAKMDESTD